jgi:hypothetical protein
MHDNGYLGKVEVAKDIGGEGLCELLRGDVGHIITVVLDRSIVDQDVNMTQLLDNLGHNILGGPQDVHKRNSTCTTMFTQQHGV